jgi:indole-3-glycerol phosphate synthase
VILDEILEHKREEVAERKRLRPEIDVRSAAAAAEPSRDFRSALRAPGISVIAEVKRASPAKGALRLDADAARLACRYASAGAAAISVLTDGRYFRGCDDDLVAVRSSVAVPILRKEFIVDRYQLYESRAIGADAILLIVRALRAPELREFHRLGLELGMAVLVEVHNEAELELALDADADLVGINNRDLTRMVVDLSTTSRLRPLVPPGVVVVSESGIRSAEDARAFAGIGVDAILVGEALVTAADPGTLIAELTCAGVPTAGAISSP